MEINDEVRGTYSPNKQIKFKTSMLRSSLCDYSDAYIPGLSMNILRAGDKVVFSQIALAIYCLP